MKTGLFDKAKYCLAGDQGLLAEYGEGIDPDISKKVRTMARSVGKNKPKGVMEIIPTYRSLLLIYDPCLTNPYIIEHFMDKLEKRTINEDAPPSNIVEIPVCYGGDYGPDIDTVASTNNISVDEVIKIHSQSNYLIYMVGFTPGFPYLGGLSEKLFTPRLETPRLKVPKGSVGIANNQTGVYPIESPGGWQLIGQTPLNLFDPDRLNPILYQAGDKIKFTPITDSEFKKIVKKESL
ncbi:MAG: 5-oxoprolinase subunit PxpB [Desulfobacteraceae bacterium]|nr:5-oxoprolinase subunit PxpB [Desulfobacteraceae bacterium]